MKARMLLLGALLLALLPALAAAQGGTGDLFGTVADEPGQPVAGVTVRAQGEGAAFETTTDGAGRYRLLHLRPGTYTLVFTLPGHATVERRRVRVAMGRTAEVRVYLKKTTRPETITVVEDNRMPDPRRAGRAASFTREELDRVPVPGEPHALAVQMPGAYLDRNAPLETTTGLPPVASAHGVRPQDGTWTIDGVDVSERRAPFTAPAAVALGSLYEVQLATAGQGLRHATPGAALHVALPHADEDLHGAAHGFTRILGGTPEARDHLEGSWDLGGSVGGPLAEDRLWGWAGAGRQRVRGLRGPEARAEETTATQAALRLDWQPALSHHLGLSWFRGQRDGSGLGTGLCAGCLEAPEATWRRDEGGSGLPGLLKLESTHAFGPAFLQARVARFRRDVSLVPAGGLAPRLTISPSAGRTSGSTLQIESRRTRRLASLDFGAGFNGAGLGHELRLGAAYARDDEDLRGFWPGEGLVDVDGRTAFIRDGHADDRVHHLAFYAEDRMVVSRLTLLVGARLDRQWGDVRPTRVEVAPGIFAEEPGHRTPFTWSDVSPRMAATFGLDAVRRTVVRAGIGRYGGRLSAAEVGYDSFNKPRLVPGAEILAGGFGPLPLGADTVDEGYSAPRTHEFVAGFDREARPNLLVSLSYVHRRNTRLPADLLPGPYVPGAVLTGSLSDGQPYAVQTFVPASVERRLVNREGYRQVFHGWELAVLRRFQKKWGLRLAVSYDDWEERFSEGVSPYFGNPTPLDVDPLVDEGKVGVRAATGGPGDDVFVGGRWSLSAYGAWSLPAELELAGGLVARRGTAMPVFHQATLGETGSWRVLASPAADTFRLDSTWTLDLRLSRPFALGGARLTVAAEAFNLLDGEGVMERYRNAASSLFGHPTRWTLPRTVRLGLRAAF
ncbi:MAG TPA: carboxypeptidase regulatory-like domain-containing protein [Vicinamibacteria bacterium]|jgi:hypothetical protein